jgi:predicted GIY-YIG superfamily endonuclease
MWHVYILLCDQKTFYTGITDDPEKRLSRHRGSRSLFTKKFSDIQFVFCENYPSKREAAIREKQIKGWSHKKKQKLVNGELGQNVCTELVEVLGGVG